MTACEGVDVRLEGDEALDVDCRTGELRPGTRVEDCTLGFVLTDGSDLYFTTAGHCAPSGARWSHPAIGAFGTTVLREAERDLPTVRDWGLIRVDEEDESHVDPTMYRWGGPSTLGSGDQARPPLPGDVVLYYGQGSGPGSEPATQGRAGQVLAVLPTAFALEGAAGRGDSGAPIRFSTGEPAGMLVAAVGPQLSAEGGPLGEVCDPPPPGERVCEGSIGDGGIYGALLATRFDVALAWFEERLGLDLTLVEGRTPGVRTPLSG